MAAEDTYFRDKCLNKGRQVMARQFEARREAQPDLGQVCSRGVLDVELWLRAHLVFSGSGLRIMHVVETRGEYLLLEYSAFSNGARKAFQNRLPGKIELDDDFAYFFGLWCGDRTGGGRFGVMNKCPELNQATAEYLIRLGQTPKRVLYVGDLFSGYSGKFDERVRINGMHGDFVIGVLVVNGFLKSFFDFLDENLQEVLTLINPRAFFAGLFDAEGNVFLEDGCVRWACKSPAKVRVYAERLEKLGLFDRYDGGNLISHNLAYFSKVVLPSLKHPEKINKINLLTGGQGWLDTRFKRILLQIRINNGVTCPRLAELLELKKVYSQVGFLCKFGYVEKRGYPLHLYLTQKGLNELVEVVL